MTATKDSEKAAGTGAIPDPVLRSIGFLSFFDRFATPPMLVVLASRTGMTLAEAVGLVASYALFYALGQPLWGFISDRFGRVTVLRTALAGLAVAAVASTLFSAHAPLLVARSAAGLMAGCLYPTLLTIIGDTRTGIERARGLSDLQIYSALGTTGATLAAGALAAFTDWRVVFGLPALGCLALLFFLRRAHDGATHRRGHVDFRAAFSGAALGVYGVAVLEGAVLMGILTYFVPALQHADVPIALAGLLAAAYGVGVIVGARFMRGLVKRFTRTQLMGIGGVILLVGYAASSVAQIPVTVTATALLVGASNAVLHSSVQGWATEVAPKARATTVALFACALFLGSSVGTFLTAGFADAGRYGAIFLLGLGATGVLIAVVTLGHSAWERRRA
ncbi:4-hydroxybenzoate transporter [Sinomonas cyclohexanicum]|uniref:4-hydroxybenzoate transporter n=1 Tax=Sinomonas cyclohexanicum TaxID=322009 RepID=A0ABM7Q0S0_SINCY|nr:MFS transporter [Corynebacterium cyclohexanicum]BCT78170.1 4-hydroxybenzoate transporter [Corynebacterium cyclohexanicum]